MKRIHYDKAVVDEKDLDDFIDKSIHNDALSVFILPISDFEKMSGLNGYMDDKSRADFSGGGLFCFKNNELVQLAKGVNWEYICDICHQKLIFSSNFSIASERMIEDFSIIYNDHEYVDSLEGVYIVIVDDVTQEVVCVRQVIFEGGEAILNIDIN